MNIDIRQYLRINPISTHALSISDNGLDCFLYFPNLSESCEPIAYTQDQMFQALYESIFGSLVKVETVDVDGVEKTIVRFNYDNIVWTNGTRTVITWNSDAQLSNVQFSKYVRYTALHGQWNTEDEELAQLNLDATVNQSAHDASWRTFRLNTEKAISELEQLVDDKLKSLKRTGKLNYLGAVELQSKLVDLSSSIYDSSFAYALGHIWCSKENESIQAGQDRSDISTPISHNHNDTKAEAMTESFTTRSGGGQVIGDFVIGNRQMVSSDKFKSLAETTMSMLKPESSSNSSYSGSLTYPLWGQNVIDWRNPDRSHNNMPPSCNIYVRYCTSVDSRQTGLMLRRSVKSVQDTVVDEYESKPQSIVDYYTDDTMLDESDTKGSIIEAGFQSSTVADLEDEYKVSSISKNDCLLRLSLDQDGNISLAKQTVEHLLTIFAEDGCQRFNATVSGDLDESQKLTLSMSDFLDDILGKELVPLNEFFSWYNGLIQRLDALKDNIGTIWELLRSVKLRSYVGRIIISTTDDIESKVIANYGGKHWRRILNFLRGVEQDSNDIGRKFGEEFVCLRESNVPIHTHDSTIRKPTASDENWDVTGSVDHMEVDRSDSETKILNYDASTSEQNGYSTTPGLTSVELDYQLSPLEYENTERITVPHNNLPPYKEVYIWECVDASDEEINIDESLCKVIFDTNEGEDSRQYTYYIRKNSTLGTLIPLPERSGYEFAKWWTDRVDGDQISESTVVNEETITFYAHWKVNEYVITFHWIGNGDQTQTICRSNGIETDDIICKQQNAKDDIICIGKSGKPEYQQTYQIRLKYGAQILVNAPSSIFTQRYGYSFIGWFQNESHTGEQLVSSDTVYRDADYYAAYKYGKFVVTFDANGGRINDINRETTTKGYQYGAKLGVLPKTYWVEDSWGDAEFEGWYTDKDGETKIDEGTIVTGTTTFYAHWVKTLPYVRYSRFANASGNPTTDEREVKIETDGSGNELASCFNINKYLYSIKKLNLSGKFTLVVNASSSDVVNVEQVGIGCLDKQFGLSIGISTGKTNWIGSSNTGVLGTCAIEPNREYWWKFVIDPENREMGYISTTGIEYDLDYSNSRSSSLLSSGETLVLGYNNPTDAISNPAFWRGVLNLGKTYILKDGHKYKFKPQYAIAKFDSDGGNRTPDSKKLIGGSWVGTLDNTITKEHYDLSGWYTKKNGEGDRITEYSNIPTSGEITYYAKWTPVKYTITWNAMGGSETSPWKDREYLSTLGTLPTTIRDGSDFLGWFTTPAYVEQIDSNRKVIGDATYYAKWKTNQYVVTYDGQGGTPERKNDTVNYNDTISKLPTATREGYTFKDWWTSTTGGEQLTTSTHITHDITYYAHWEIQKYTIKWDAQGGTTVSDWTNREYRTRLGTLPTTTRTGYVFLGWYTEPSSGTKVIPDRTVLGNATFYAQWNVDCISLTDAPQKFDFSHTIGIAQGSGSKSINYFPSIDFTTDNPINLIGKSKRYLTLSWDMMRLRSSYTGTTTSRMELWIKFNNGEQYNTGYLLPNGELVSSNTGLVGAEHAPDSVGTLKYDTICRLDFGNGGIILTANNAQYIANLDSNGYVQLLTYPKNKVVNGVLCVKETLTATTKNAGGECDIVGMQYYTHSEL